MVFNWFKRQFSQEDTPDVEDQSVPEQRPEEAEGQTAEQTETAGQLELSESTFPVESAPSEQAVPALDSPPAESALESADSEETPRSAEDYLAWAKAAFESVQTVGEPLAPRAADSASVDSAPAEVSSTLNQEALADPEVVTEAMEEAAASPVEGEEIAPSPPPTASREVARASSELDASSQPSPEQDMDEGFLWSAEVLAAQGRRPEEISDEEITWLKKLRRGLDKTRRGLVNQLKSVVGQGPLNQEAVDEIETLLLQADVGIEATDIIVEALQGKIREQTLPPDQAIAYLKSLLREMLDRPYHNGYVQTLTPVKNQLNIWLLTGVNGVGKTTTIGKLTNVATSSGYTCLIAAADTFRAAAVEQIKVWGQRSDVEVICNPGKNTDPAAVVFDAITAAQSRQTELLLVDTAGRLQNKKNLMDELAKIRRIIQKKAPEAQIESLLVLDATLGQNGLRQAQVFSQSAQLTGVVLTKLDGTAKGGVALGVVQQLGLPIRFIGAGEGISDLRPFSSYEFVEALLSS
ncbi:signal recognition particle-docking protein FtsY [Lyngbya confervoides]|uniref:Signal recognition particle receptor FtsY n=1 Tax=Lyngbya confervoides BDU141951 TaxID=1574623 RepID=A0ABD4T829_9CYAN|nr:signal recognition particle-docking protein FtsY [Lyngbya confervoides]MCM1984660.1 signal recognition particle-docking protein FtsY [Lyngbya confervoides BDU141951]